MRRAMLAMVLGVLVLAMVPTVATAQTIQTGDCAPGVPNAADMAGVYLSMESAMRVTVFPCGVELLWSNTNGTHRAAYSIVERLSGGGFLVRVNTPDPYVGTLDGRVGFGFAPDEPGWVKLLTIGPFGDNPRLYRLQKV